jgi:glycosyltransferase involved in cell wall biosynthesis
VCLGTLHEVKGQTHLIEACRILRQRGRKLHLHFIGDGPDLAARQRQAAEAQLADCVTFHGAVARSRVVELLRQSDIVATPSVPSRDGRREGIPVALMEAMASGVPVVASRLSGIPELVEHEATGLLAPAGDAVALADALERLLDDVELRRRLGKAGRETIEREFDLHVNAARLIERFQTAVHGEPCGAQRHELADATVEGGG